MLWTWSDEPVSYTTTNATNTMTWLRIATAPPKPYSRAKRARITLAWRFAKIAKYLERKIGGY